MKPNTLLNRVQREDLDTDMQAQLYNATQLTGDATFIEVFGNNPKVFNWYIDDFYQKLFYSGRIETTLVELIRLRLANIHGCAFCNKGDSVHALEAGISQQQIDSLDDPKEPLFSKREILALELANTMALTNLKGQLSEELYKELSAEFKDSEIIEIGLIMAVLVGVTKMNFALDIVEKEDYCPF